MTPENSKRLKSIRFGVLSIIFVLIPFVMPDEMPPENRFPSIYGIFTFLSAFAAAITGIMAIKIGCLTKCKIGIIGGGIGGGFSAFFFIISFLGLLLTISTDRQPCQHEMQRLSSAVQQFCKDNEGSLPDAEAWCDQALESVEYPKFFQITGGHGYSYDTPVVKISNFAFNKNLNGYQLANIDRQTVLVFEAEPGWNQNGASDILLEEGHAEYSVFLNGGAHFLFVGPDSTFTVKFIKNSEIGSLNWEK